MFLDSFSFVSWYTHQTCAVQWVPWLFWVRKSHTGISWQCRPVEPLICCCPQTQMVDLGCEGMSIIFYYINTYRYRYPYRSVYLSPSTCMQGQTMTKPKCTTCPEHDNLARLQKIVLRFGTATSLWSHDCHCLPRSQGQRNPWINDLKNKNRWTDEHKVCPLYNYSCMIIAFNSFTPKNPSICRADEGWYVVRIQCCFREPTGDPRIQVPTTTSAGLKMT